MLADQSDEPGSAPGRSGGRRWRTLFEGLDRRLDFKLIRNRVFGNGSLLLCYDPIRQEGAA